MATTATLWSICIPSVQLSLLAWTIRLTLTNRWAHKNLECITRLLEMANFDVWAAWGANVGKRRNSHLLDSLSQIWRAFEKREGDFDAKWFRLGELTSAGHPRRPLRVAYSEDPVEFDVDLYLKRLGY